MFAGTSLKIAFLSTYPPRACGIASFTADIVANLKKMQNIEVGVIAINDDTYTYNDDVWFEIQQQEKKDYTTIAEKINLSDIDLVIVEHEYGIFGGTDGEYVLDFIQNIHKPIITTLHTILPEPKAGQMRVLEELGKSSDKIITMAHNSKELLQNVYHLPEDKIVVIHHGVPEMDLPTKHVLKNQFQLEDRTVITTFGLLSEGKGLEYAIKAIEMLVAEYPDVLFLILGRTHPVVLREFGETYRESLEELVHELHLEDHVRFVNKYLTSKELMSYLKLSDLYISPYLSKDQAISGTLSYAMGYGKVIISTPYLYAEELLAHGRGLLTKFKDEESIANAIAYVLSHPNERKEIEKRALSYGREMSWPCVTNHYLRTFYGVYLSHQLTSASIKDGRLRKAKFPFPRQIFRMTDDTGMFQHGIYNLPNRQEGYTTDDNIRALMMASLLYKTTHEAHYLELVYNYLGFVTLAHKNQWFRNFMGYQREFLEKVGSQDCFGRCIWGLGFITAQTYLPEEVRKVADFILSDVLSSCRRLEFHHSKAYAILGLYYWSNEDGKMELSRLADELLTEYQHNKSEDWHWIDEEINYCNAIFPWSLLLAYETTENPEFQTAGLESLDFLCEQTFYQGYFSPVGCNGWYPRGGEKALVDQQPVEACETVLACLTAYHQTNHELYQELALQALRWYTGENFSGESLIDPITGGCLDGIEERSLNQNEGAECLVSWYIAVCTALEESI